MVAQAHRRLGQRIAAGLRGALARLHGADSERGFSLIEALVAATVTTVGIGTAMGVFGSSQRATVQSQRHEVAVQQAQAELDKLRLLSYDKIALTDWPGTSSDPNDPRSRVSGTNLQVKQDLQEALVVDPQGSVNPGPTAFAVGDGAGVTGKIYRFVTWRDENCPSELCDGPENTKRITVAITLDPAGTVASRPPIWISSVAADPADGPPGSEGAPNANPGSGEPVTAQTFYLYDTPCSETERAEQTGDHATRNTAASAAQPADQSSCENPDPDKRPELMGVDPPPQPPEGEPPPLYTFSSDLTGNYPGGLALQKRGSSCPTSYPAEDAEDPSQPNKWNVHAWASNPLPQEFTVSRRVAFSLYTGSVGGTSGNGTVCATLIDRETAGGQVEDNVIGSVTYSAGNWPASITDIVFSFDLAESVTVAADHRLVVVLSVRGESNADLYFVYDHPTYQSFVQVGTTTPLQ
jgi:type II secretory pathway pseudopilin PulG